MLVETGDWQSKLYYSSADIQRLVYLVGLEVRLWFSVVISLCRKEGRECCRIWNEMSNYCWNREGKWHAFLYHILGGLKDV
jgi:hypothetical protein